MKPLNPLTVTLGVQNVSFVAQAVDWVPEVLYNIVSAAYRHKGLSFVRIIQRCPEWLPNMFDPCLHDPSRMRMLTHENGVQLSPALAKVYRNQEQHDPSNLDRARKLASNTEQIPVGIFYRNPDIPCYEELRYSAEPRSVEYVKAGLEAQFDKFTIRPH